MSLILTTFSDSNWGAIQDRIRSIAHALGLQTIIWKYDSNDWKNGIGNVTEQTVDDDYNYFISNATSGTFDTVSSFSVTLQKIYCLLMSHYDAMHGRV